MKFLGTLSLFAVLSSGASDVYATRIIWTPPCKHAQMESDKCQLVRVDLQMTISSDMKEFSVAPIHVTPEAGYGDYAQCVAKKWRHYPQIPAPQWKPGVQKVTYTVSMGKGCAIAP